MMLYISIKFLETILNGFQVIERTRLYHCQNYMDKSYGSARRKMTLYICMKFRENIWNGFQVIERTRLRDGRTDRQTDRQPMQKQYGYTPVMGKI